MRKYHGLLLFCSDNLGEKSVKCLRSFTTFPRTFSAIVFVENMFNYDQGGPYSFNGPHCQKKSLLLLTHDNWTKHYRYTEFHIIFEPRHAKTCLMPYANNKGADQPAYPRCLISTFVVRCLDSMICILAISKVSRV